MGLTKITEEKITNGTFVNQLQKADISCNLTRCDCICFLFECNDTEQADFVKETNEKFAEIEQFKYVPKILVQTKTEMLQSQGSLTCQQLARDLDIKIYKEILTGNQEIVDL